MKILAQLTINKNIKDAFLSLFTMIHENRENILQEIKCTCTYACTENMFKKIFILG